MKRTPLARGTKQLKRSGFKVRSTPLAKKTTLRRLEAKKPHAKKEQTQAKLKKELDRLFSLYIRKIYPPFCYTCGKPAERLQNGHYISRQYLATRWSEKNCRPQCWGCNGYGKGQPLIFEEKLKAEYGNDFVEEMKASRHQTIKLDRNWYLAEIERYKAILEGCGQLY